MKKTIWILIAVLVAFGIMVTVVGLGIGYLTGRAAVPSRSVLVVSFSGPVHERQPALVLTPQPSFHRIIQSVRKAATDNHIDSVLVYGDAIPFSLAQRQELHDALEHVVASEKPVMVHFNAISLAGYSVVPEGAEVIMHNTPGGYVYFTGYYAPQIFMRRLLEEKLGIRMNVVHVGDYKGAGEPFSRDSMSRYLREELTTFLDDLWNQMIDQVPETRNIPAAPFREKLYNGELFNLSPEQARENGLVDRFAFRLDLEEQYPATISIRRYARHKSMRFSSSPIGLIIADGEIVMGSAGNSPLANTSMIASDTTCRAIRDAADDPRIKAIVFRINSPGGSPLASELIYQELKRAARIKPVVASVGSMAASGGYYIACGCDTILASETSLVGSIGVVAVVPDMTGLMDKIGVNVDPVEKGRYADFLTPYEPIKDDHASMLRESMMDVYMVFKDRVATGRDMTVDQVEPLARGRVYSGKRGHELKLVDKLGGLTEALAEAAQRAGIERTDYRIISRKPTLLEMLTEANLQESLKLESWVKELPAGEPLLIEPALVRFEEAIR